MAVQGNFSVGNSSFTCGDSIFHITEKISKENYTLLISGKAKLPNNAQKLKHGFTLTEEDLKCVFSLPQTAASEPYVKAFQFKILNSILFANKKLLKDWIQRT